LEQRTTGDIDWEHWCYGNTYIAAANTGVADVDDDIVGVLELGDGAVFEFDLVDAL
jgi:hypothetical protein